ncbi:unnamed protein product [Taenia asiatica]|uniref:Uncharacterized protein n=1 Tax=Taenia asiatica TaxID=60517 RepID=A0A0R3W805_TAEAS|nr:unnamed protein product [Taenia asiatica]
MSEATHAEGTSSSMTRWSNQRKPLPSPVNGTCRRQQSASTLMNTCVSAIDRKAESGVVDPIHPLENLEHRVLFNNNCTKEGSTRNIRANNEW